jgi:hypothetical protein
MSPHFADPRGRPLEILEHILREAYDPDSYAQPSPSTLSLISKRTQRSARAIYLRRLSYRKSELKPLAAFLNDTPWKPGQYVQELAMLLDQSGPIDPVQFSVKQFVHFKPILHSCFNIKVFQYQGLINRETQRLFPLLPAGLLKLDMGHSQWHSDSLRVLDEGWLVAQGSFSLCLTVSKLHRLKTELLAVMPEAVPKLQYLTFRSTFLFYPSSQPPKKVLRKQT